MSGPNICRIDAKTGSQARNESRTIGAVSSAANARTCSCIGASCPIAIVGVSEGRRYVRGLRGVDSTLTTRKSACDIGLYGGRSATATGHGMACSTRCDWQIGLGLRVSLKLLVVALVG